jgi:hypothetical protein
MGEELTMTIETPLPPPSGAAPAPSPVRHQPPPRSRGVRILWLVFGGVLVVAALTWGAYEVVSILSHEERTEINTYPAAGLRAVDISNDSGSVRIVATDGDEVTVRAEISEGLRATGERQQIAGDVLELRATCPNFGSDWCGVSYELQVPRDLDLVVHADSGSIDVTGVTGDVDVNGDNGSVELTGLSGTIRASTDNGGVEGFALRSSSVTVDSDNGGVFLEFTQAPTTVEATTDNGSVEVVVPNDGAGYRVDVQSDSGTETDEVLEDPASPRSITIRTDNGSATARTAS